MRALFPLMLLLAACPPPEPLVLQCLDERSELEVGSGQLLIVDLEKMSAAIAEKWKESGKPAQKVVPGPSCDVKFGFDVMTMAGVQAVMPPAETEVTTDWIAKMEAGERAVPVRAAGGVSPGPGAETGTARRETLRGLVGLDKVKSSGKGVGVAVVDAGAKLAHPAIAAALDTDQVCNVEKGCGGAQSACKGPGCAACVHDNECIHGTGMSSAIGGRTTVSVAPDKILGLFYAPDAKLKLVRVLAQSTAKDGGWAVPMGDTARIVRALKHLRTQTKPEAFPVVYLGFAAEQLTSELACSAKGPLRKAVEKLAKERIVVAPAGNQGLEKLAAPACFENVISVAASGRAADEAHADLPDVAAFWSNGALLASMLAPGEDIPVATNFTLPDGTETEYSWSNGTSVAAAQVAGAFALAVEEKGVVAMLGKTREQRVACIADTSVTPPKLDLGQLKSCP